MIKIYKLTDRIPVKVGPELTFWVSPLSLEHKAKLSWISKKVSGESLEVALDGASLALKYSLKQIDGVVGADNMPYELEFEADGSLTDDCVSEVVQLDGIEKLTRLILRWGLLAVADPKDLRAEYEQRLLRLHNEGKLSEEDYLKALDMYPLDGVTIDFTAVRGVKKKQSAAMD